MAESAPTAAEGYEPQDTMYLWWMADPSNPRFVGELQLVDRGRGVSLRYADGWLREGLPLSEDLPLEARVFLPSKKDAAAGAVDDARPDRWGERVIRALDKPKRLSLMEFLYFAGDNRFGALGVSLERDQYVPNGTTPMPSLADVNRIHEIVMKVAANEPVTERERRLVSPGRTMGGAKPKSVVLIDGVEWVLKFADEYDHDWPLIEHATMSLGALCDINMCNTRSVPFAPRRSAIAVRRFDRASDGKRIHSISAAVVLQAAGESDGYPELASVFRRLLRSEVQDAARAELFRRMVFNILSDNTDDHERNHALVLADGGYDLSPAFDVVPAMQNLRYQALRVGASQNDSTLDNALSEHSAFGLSKKEAVKAIRDICEVLDGWRRAMASLGVSDRDIQALEPFLEGDKAAMRREFISLA